VHLEGSAVSLDAKLGQHGGRAFTSVNGAAVTQASTAIPGIALYLSLLHSVLGEAMRSPTSQSADLWDQLLGIRALDLDEDSRIRLDRCELAQDVQDEVSRRWAACDQDSLITVADSDWFQAEVMRLYGFGVPGIDYAMPSEPDLPWPSG
jgi:enoyl-[acyl-carrier protein] reductase/trans-2-enoyl-CoA reductase (NAD+)